MRKRVATVGLAFAALAAAAGLVAGPAQASGASKKPPVTCVRIPLRTPVTPHGQVQVGYCP